MAPLQNLKRVKAFAEFRRVRIYAHLVAGSGAIYRAMVGRHKWRPYRVECGLQGLGAFVKDSLSPSMATLQNLKRVKAFAEFRRVRINAHLVAARFIAQWLSAAKTASVSPFLLQRVFAMRSSATCARNPERVLNSGCVATQRSMRSISNFGKVTLIFSEPPRIRVTSTSTSTHT